MASSPQSHTAEFESILTEVFPFDEPTTRCHFDTEHDKFTKVLTPEILRVIRGNEKPPLELS